MWTELKDWWPAILHISKDALHFHFGMALYLICVLALRRGLANSAAWLVCVVAVVVNESVDLLAHQPQLRGWHLADSIRDFLGTLLFPTVLLVLAKSRPNWLIPAREAGTLDESAKPEDDD